VSNELYCRREEKTYLVQVLPDAKMMAGQRYSPLFFLSPSLYPVPSLAFVARECHAFSLTMKTFRTVIAGVMVMFGDGRGVRCLSVGGRS